MMSRATALVVSGAQVAATRDTPRSPTTASRGARCSIFLRSDDVEVSGGVLDANGVRIECNDAEKAALKGGAEHCWWVR